MSRRFALLLAVALAPFAIAAGCSDPPTRPGPAGEGSAKPPPPVGGGVDGGTDGGTSTEAGADAGACTSVPLTGLLVDRIGVVGDPPVSNGGVLVDATYDLAVYSVYVGAGGVGGPTGITAKATVVISGGVIDDVFEIASGTSAPTLTRTSSSYSTQAATLATTEICPTTGARKDRQYTSSDTQLIITDVLTKETFTFTKR